MKLICQWRGTLLSRETCSRPGKSRNYISGRIILCDHHANIRAAHFAAVPVEVRWG